MKSHYKPLSVFDVLSYWLVLLALAVLITVCRCVKANDNPDGNLVTVDWLAKNLSREDILILDASPEKNYSENHIPGAVNVNVYAFGMIETPVQMMEKLFRSAGISAEKNIVIYDQGGSILAPRMFYSLYYHGFPKEKLFILDGGFSKWMRKKLTVTKDVPITLQGDFTIKERNENVRVMLDEFLTASGDTKNNALIEALDPEWHYGQIQVFDRGGHIPNAVLLPSEDFFNGDKTFKSPEEINKMLAYHGINPGQKILTHCGGGVSAAVPFFVLKFITNYGNVKLFMESQMGWLKDERSLPFWTYDKPYLLRESAWLQAWNGKMLRRFGISQISIIDVRPPDEYTRGHLPFSVNIPADVFKNNINNPAGLAEILGKNGVEISHEAVIASGAGITKESALAFVLLEILGQKKVSLFSDSMEKFTALGYSLANDTPVFEPVKYVPDGGIDVIIKTIGNAKGIFPDVYIASGESIPQKTFGGEIIHLPYKDFLNTDGTPKAAKDVWSILKKAGVPRYGRIICYSDNPGEAAVNCFIFKLMGFPDIKMLVM